MKTPILREEKSHISFFVGWTFLSVLFLFLTSAISVLFLPLAACALSLIYIYSNEQKILFIGISALSLIVCILLGIEFFLPALASVATGFGIAYSFIHEKHKCTATLWLSLIIAGCICGVLYYYLAVIAETENLVDILSFFKEKYLSLMSEFSDELILAMKEYGQELLTSDEIMETLELAYDRLVSCLFAIILVFGFVLDGFSMKFFKAYVKKYDENRDIISSWHFTTPSLFAWFYAIVFAISMFVSYENIFGIVLLNCKIIFLPVFAYLGFKFIWLTSYKLKNGGTALRVGLIFGSIIFFSFAIYILSLYGAFIIISVNRITNQNDDGNGFS